MALGWTAFKKINQILKSKTFPLYLKSKICDSRTLEPIFRITLRDSKINEQIRDKTKIKVVLEKKRTKMELDWKITRAKNKIDNQITT